MYFDISISFPSLLKAVDATELPDMVNAVTIKVAALLLYPLLIEYHLLKYFL